MDFQTSEKNIWVPILQDLKLISTSVHMGLTKSVYTMHHVQSERPQHIRKWPNAPGIARVILTPSALWYKNFAFAYRTRKGRPPEIFQNRLQVGLLTPGATCCRPSESVQTNSG